MCKLELVGPGFRFGLQLQFSVDKLYRIVMVVRLEEFGSLIF